MVMIDIVLSNRQISFDYVQSGMSQNFLK